MADLYLLALVVVLAGIVIHGLQAPQRFYEYPYFMAAPFVAFILPQAISLYRYPFGTPPEAVDAVLLMTLLCVLACVFGYRASVNRWVVEKSQIPLDDRKLFRWGVFFILCGFFFTYMIGTMSVEERGGGQWTGRATIYLFFANLNFLGLAICLRQALKNKRDYTAWFWSAAGAVIPVVAGLLHARREPTALFLLTVALTLFFQKRFVFPRWLIACGLVAAMVAIPATTQIRIALNRAGVTGIWNIDFVQSFRQFTAGSTVLEYRNAAMLIESTKRTGRYGFGRAYWDQLVFRFVPAQLVGRGVKEGLMFRTAQQRDNEDLAILGYEQVTGTTVTGIGDAYREFGYSGALFFAALAVVFKSLWQASLRPSGVFAQLLYIQIAISAMNAVTHQTVNFLPGLVYNLGFLGAAAYFSGVSPKPQPVRRVARPTI